MSNSPQQEMAGLGANERALLGAIAWGPARRLAIKLVRLKMRLQFTGWLQYLILLPPALLLLLLAGISAVFAGMWGAAVFLAPAAALLVVILFDIVTSKFLLRFPETRPPRRETLGRLELILARSSCRSFQSNTLSEQDRDELLEFVRQEHARPAMGQRQPRLVYVSAPLTVWPVVNASEFLVAIVPKHYSRVAVIDVGRTLQRVVVQAVRMGLGTCWIGPGADQVSIAAELGERFDPEAEHIVCVCAVGYASRYAPLFVRLFTKKMSSTRLAPEGLFFADPGLTRPLDTRRHPFDRYEGAYEACRWSPSSYNGQTTRLAVEADESGEVTAAKFFAVTSSRYYAPVALGIWCANWELATEALGRPGYLELGPGFTASQPHHDVTWRPNPKRTSDP